MSDSVERRPLEGVAREVSLLASFFLAALVGYRFYMGYSLFLPGGRVPILDGIVLLGLAWLAAFLTIWWLGAFVGALWCVRSLGLPRSILFWVPLCILAPLLVLRVEPMMLGVRIRLSEFSEADFLTLSAQSRKQVSQANLKSVSYLEGRDPEESIGVQRAVLDELHAHDVMRPWRKELLTLSCGPESVMISQYVEMFGTIGFVIYDRDLEASQKDDVRAKRVWLGKRRLTERVYYFIKN